MTGPAATSDDPSPAMDSVQVNQCAISRANQQPAFDASVFSALVHEIGEEGAAEVHDVFINETRSRLARFRSARLDDERAEIAREAHSLKSGAGSFGYRRAAALARELERRAADVTTSDYLAMLTLLDAAFAAGQDAFRT